MKPIVVFGLPFNKGKRGGIVSLHKLVKLLNEKGREAYIVGSKYDTMEGVKEASAELMLSKDFHAIYPEGYNQPQIKNKGKNFVWLLHFPKREYIGFDHWLHFEPAYAKGDSQPLKVIDIDLDLYCNDNQPRKGKAHVYHKNQLARQMDAASKDSLCLDGYEPRGEDLPAILNSREEFMCYDHYSFNSVLAALCGCRSIVLPIPDVPKHEYVAKRPFGEFLCYGENDTVENQSEKAREAILKQYAETDKQIDSLLNLLD
jgi:hypothetical protein